MGRKGKKIIGYNVGRGNIRVFDNGKEAAEWLGLLPQNINASLKNNYMGTLDGWEFFYYDNFFNTDYYSSPDKAEKIGLYKLECFRDATERRGIYIGEKIRLQNYVNNYLKDLISLYEKELAEYEIKIAEINHEIDLLRAKIHSMKIKIDYCNYDIDIFKRFADNLTNIEEADWNKEKYINLMKKCQDMETKTETISKEINELMDCKDNIYCKYFDKGDELRELENIYDEFVEILKKEFEK